MSSIFRWPGLMNECPKLGRGDISPPPTASALKVANRTLRFPAGAELLCLASPDFSLVLSLKDNQGMERKV